MKVKFIATMTLIFILSTLQASENVRNSYDKAPIYTRYGTLTEGENNTLVYKGVAVSGVAYMPASASYRAKYLFELNNSVVVMLTQGGGTSCPGNYSLVTVTEERATAINGVGTCYDDDSFKPELINGVISFEMTNLGGVGKSRFVFSSGKLYVNGRLTDMDPQAAELMVLERGLVGESYLEQRFAVEVLDKIKEEEIRQIEADRLNAEYLAKKKNEQNIQQQKKELEQTKVRVAARQNEIQEQRAMGVQYEATSVMEYNDKAEGSLVVGKQSGAIFESLVSVLITWTIGLLPAILVRYAIIKRPLRKSISTILSFVFCAILWVPYVIISGAFGGSKSAGAVWILIFFVSRWLLTSGYKPVDAAGKE